MLANSTIPSATISANHVTKTVASIEDDLARIRQSWQEYKKASAKPDAFSFLARIAATGKIRTGLQAATCQA